MKYCTSNYQWEAYRMKVQELRFSIKNLNGALHFLENERHQEHRILLEIPDIHNMGITQEKLWTLAKENRQLVLDFFKLEDLIIAAKATDKQCNYMYHYQVTTWALVQILMYYHVSDMLIGEPITFEMDRVQNNIKSVYDINIRVCPHLGRQISESVDDGVKHFWILPQHMYLYENIIDVCDLIDNNTVREGTLVDIYTKGEPYIMPLNLLITNCDKDIPAGRITEDMIKRRKNCGQKCMVNKNLCHMCSLFIKLAEVVPKKES